MMKATPLTLKKKLALELWRRQEKLSVQEHPLRQLFWECTLRCNLHCRHCGSDCKVQAGRLDMPKEDFLRVLDSVARRCDPHQVFVVVSGGEPLMREDLEEVCSDIYHRGFPWGMVTNGLYLTRERLVGLLKAGMHSITISLDGLEADHNWMRGSQQSFSSVERALGLLRQVPQLTYDIVTCVNRRNYPHLHELKEYLISQGVKHWRLFTVFPVGRAASDPQMQLTDEEFRGVFEFIRETRHEGRIQCNYGCEGFLGNYEGEVRDHLYTCQAGVTIGSVLIDGSISACTSIRSNYKQGNIYDGDDFMDVWEHRFLPFRDREWMRKDECAQCSYFGYCKGGGMHLRDNAGKLLLCHIKRLTALLIVLCSLVIHPSWAQPREVHILATNDMHATIEVFPQLAAIADSLRALYPGLLIFSAGDNRTGNPLNDQYEIPAYPMVALMNQIGFNASAIGNHEFDVSSLARLTGLANFRYLCCNMQAADSTGIRALPYQVFDVNGLRVGVIGVIQLSPEGIPSTHPDNLRGISFMPAKEALGQYEWLSRECDVTILLSHLGLEDDRRLADDNPWIDLIIGGHTHIQLKGGEMQNNVLITQNSNKLPYATHITLTVDSGRIVGKQSEYIDVRAFTQKNKLVEEMVRYFSDNPAFLRVLGRAVSPFSVKEELASMMCDAFMAGCQADIAVENPGGVRIDSLPAGDITMLDVLKMEPFDNHAVLLTLTGNQIVHMMRTYCHDRLYSFPFVGGMRCAITVEKDNPRIIKSVRLLTPDGHPLDMNRTYRVATNSYISATSEIPEGSEQVLNVMIADIIMQYIEQRQTLDYQGVRRIEIK